jgi:HK97 family phage portal protein
MLTEYFVAADLESPGVYNATYSNPTDWFIEALGGARSDAGIRIDADGAMKYAPWWQGISIIAGDVARLPLDAYKRTSDDDRERQRQLEAWRCLNQIANPIMTGYTLRELLTAHALSWGNGYAAIVRRGTETVGLIPIHPGSVTVDVDDEYNAVYKVRDDSGGEQVFPSDDILHIRGLGDNGVCGHSVYTLARNSLGLGLAAEQHGSSHFANGAKPGILLSHPARLDKPQADTLLKQWQARHQGSQNANLPALLTGGLTATVMDMSNEDSQWIESRKFQREEVASWLCLPPHKLGSDSRVSYNSLEAEERAYVNQTLARWLTRWETECFVKLFARAQQRKNWYWEHNTGALIQGDMQTQATVLTQLVSGMIITRNEARKKLNMNTVDGGDEFVNPNTTTDGGSPEETDEPSEQPSDDDDMVEAMRSLIRDRVAHQVRIEVNTLTDMGQDDKQLVQRIGKFYDRLQDKMEAALKPCVRVYRTAAPSKVNATAKEISQRYCEVAAGSVAAALADAPPGEHAAAIATTVGNWKDTKPQFAVSILESGILQ